MKKLFLLVCLLILLSTVSLLFLLPKRQGGPTPVTTEFEETFKNIPLTDVDSLPLLEDCRQTAKEDQITNESPTEEMLGLIGRQATILKNLQVRSGYRVGKRRVVYLGLPYGHLCGSYFVAGVWDTKAKKLLNIADYKDLAKAFIFSEKDLPKVGLLLYGDPMSASALLDNYSGAKKKPPCSKAEPPLDCNQDEVLELPKFEDGEATGESGVIRLHRYSTGCLPDDCLYHHVMSINGEGNLVVDSERIYYIVTGIIF